MWIVFPPLSVNEPYQSNSIAKISMKFFQFLEILIMKSSGFSLRKQISAADDIIALAGVSSAL